MATKRKPFETPTQEKVKLAPPLPGDNEHLESLGRFIDNLLGDARIRRQARKELEAQFSFEDETT